jgi:hypothetical protein
MINATIVRIPRYAIGYYSIKLLIGNIEVNENKRLTAKSKSESKLKIIFE